MVVHALLPVFIFLCHLYLHWLDGYLQHSKQLLDDVENKMKQGINNSDINNNSSTTMSSTTITSTTITLITMAELSLKMQLYGVKLSMKMAKNG